MTTVGYGGKAPRTYFGRVLTVMWMFLGITFLSILTSHMTQAFAELAVAYQIDTANDLEGLEVCSYPALWPFLLSSRNYLPVEAATVAECVGKLLSGAAQGVAMETEILRYWLANLATAEQRTSLRLSERLVRVPAVLVVPQDSPFKKELNVRMLKLLYDGRLSFLQSKWFPIPAAISSDTQMPIM